MRIVHDAGHNGRDLKLLDDELRFQTLHVCEPCGTAWVDDRATMESLYPLDRIGDAVKPVCLGFELANGTKVWGDARPRACR